MARSPDELIGKNIEGAMVGKETNGEHFDLHDLKDNHQSKFHLENNELPPLEFHLEAQEIIIVEMGESSFFGPCSITRGDNMGYRGRYPWKQCNNVM